LGAGDWMPEISRDTTMQFPYNYRICNMYYTGCLILNDPAEYLEN